MDNLNLENIKTGDLVTSFRVGTKIYSNPCVIGEWVERHGKFRLKTQDGKELGLLPTDGIGYDFMSKRLKPDFYYSANPKHIKIALARQKKNKSERERKEKREKKLSDQKEKLLSPIIESYRDNEECYTFEYLSTDDLKRLTIEQIKTLVSWLK